MLAAMYPESGVFINGESGTGKEVVAQMIHSHSARREQPYITVNCASISPNLFESEFFGHIRGSFTGASQDKQGFFQLANNGSLFLDEISEMPIEFQAKLLRAIDTKRVIPVGKGKEVKINCKIIASSNHDIHELIKANKFRLDLFHRINTIEILIPPLRERPEDIPELLEHFVHRYALETNKAIPEIRQDFIDKLLRYPFQGNVRELKNIVERIFILFYEPVWGAEILNNLSSFITGDVLPQSRGIADLKNIERGMIIDALKKCNWKQSEAAKLLNLTESTLCRKIKRLQIHK
jgi:DNA-binding NtrC family response regulator